MAKLRVDKIASVGVSTETTGSVFFDGTGDYLSISESGFTNIDSGDAFTIESFVYFNDLDNYSTIFASSEDSFTSGGFKLEIYDSKLRVQGTSFEHASGSTTLSTGQWYHFAFSRTSGGNAYSFVDGVLVNSTTNGSATFEVTWPRDVGIGGKTDNTEYLNGYISNVRFCDGHALYTSNFAPPTKELEVHPETILLCCYDGENIFADKSGRHIIAAIGDRVSSPTPTATDSPIGITTFQPGLERDVDNTFGPTFQGGAGYASQNWLTLPKGTTTERFVEVANNAVSASSARGINGGGYIAPNNTNTMQYITIATTGNAADFGDLSAIRNVPGAVASSTRGIWMGGVSPSPSNTSLDVIDYVTIASTGNAADFGNLINNHRADSAAGNSTRGLRLGQQQSPAVGNTIEYITIASTGDAKDFGDLVQGRSQSGAFASPTRAVNIGGYGGPSVSNVNTIDYVTIQTMGNSIDFGDLKDGVRTGARGCSNATRGVFGGGYNPTPYASDLDYVTIASTGNSQDFGNLSMGNRYGSSCSSLTRGIFFIGESTSPTPGNRQNIDYVELATLANANDFGDLISSYSGYTAAACSNGHGGLG